MADATIKTLAQAEKIITESEGSFIPLGDALRVIRDQCLFSKGSKTEETFEGYLSTRWDLSKVHAYRTIAASTIAKMAKQVGFTLNERQARELKGLEDDPEQMEVILNNAKENSSTGRLTAKSILAARKKAGGEPDPELQNGETENSLSAPDDPADDPDSNEDWDAVLTAGKRSLAKLTKEMPPQYMAAWATTLEANAKKARRRAQAGI